MLIVRKSELYYTTFGIITPAGGRPVHRLREDSLNLCWGRPRLSKIIIGWKDPSWYNRTYLVVCMLTFETIVSSTEVEFVEFCCRISVACTDGKVNTRSFLGILYCSSLGFSRYLRDINFPFLFNLLPFIGDRRCSRKRRPKACWQANIRKSGGCARFLNYL